MQRTTKSELNRIAEIASRLMGTELTLCNAPCYGGWAVEKNSGATRILERTTPAACKAFLQGLIYACEAGAA